MSRLHFLNDAQGQQELDESRFPLAIGGDASQGGIVLLDSESSSPPGYIAYSDGHAYLQAGENNPDLYLNDERLSESAWLKSGDRIQTGLNQISWTVQGDKVFIDVQGLSAEQGLHPPAFGPPATKPPVNNDMPVHHPEQNTTGSSKHRKGLFIGMIALLVLAALFLLFATPVVIRVEPEPDTLKMSGFPPPLSLWDSRLALPGRYTIEARRKGYQELNETVEIRMGGNGSFAYQLAELPGLLLIRTKPDTQWRLLVDDAEIAADAQGRAELSRGRHQIRIETDRYLPYQQPLEIAGYGERQQLNITLLPAWASLSLSSTPAGASVFIDGNKAGETPLSYDLLQGSHTLELKLSGFKPVSIRQTIEAGKDIALPPIQLQPVDGHLSVQSQPERASVMLDGVFQGTTPLELNLIADKPHRLRFSKAGYVSLEREMELKPDQQQDLKVRLKAEYGTVFLSIYPADAKLSIDGKPASKNSGRLRLSVRPHTLKLSKSGYSSRELSITPGRGVSQNIEIRLQTLAQKKQQQKVAATPPEIRTAAGQALQLIKPEGTFKMGASRREAGRRANESQRLAQLKRPFYFGRKEVSNQQYRLFKASHDSGSMDGASLNTDPQPVVNLSWDDAARYANWLSQQQGLPSAYVEVKGKMRAIQPMNTGYRLPTEAEWAWVARRQGQSMLKRYPWQGSFPPAQVSGNYADQSIGDTLADVLPNYNDGFRGTAAVGSFAAEPPGFYDLGGNVSEWIHDYYALYPGEATKLVSDPAGPVSGEHHVVRGAGWRHGNITELRLSYRDYSNKPRYDLGFRLARYAE